MGLIASILVGFIPMFFFAAFVYWLDRFEKEPLILLGAVFFWGALVASAGAFLVNTTLGVGVYMLTGSENAANLSTTVMFAPVVEESLKGLAVLLVFLFIRREFDSVLDGIVYAGVTALGFGATENAYYIYTYGFSDQGWGGFLGVAFVRVILVGWQHPFYTAFFGIGLAVARLNRSWLVRLSAPVIGWIAAISMHAMHNLLASLMSGFGILAGFAFDWSGWLAMFIFILVLIGREKRWMVQYLQDEVASGTISRIQYRTASTTIDRWGALIEAVQNGQYINTSRFYQLLAELAHKKRELAQLGDEGGNAQIIEGLRARIASLAPVVYPLSR